MTTLQSSESVADLSEETAEYNVNNLSEFGSNCDVITHSNKIGGTCISTSSSSKLQNNSSENGHHCSDFNILKDMIEKVLIRQQHLCNDFLEVRKELSLALSNDTIEREVLLLLPIRTKQDFDIIQQILEDEKESKKLVKWLSSKCGKQHDVVVEQCLLEMIHNQFSAICNFTGANGKLKVDGSWIMKTINAVLFNIGIQMTQKEVKHFLQSHLKKQYDMYMYRRARPSTIEEAVKEAFRYEI